MLKERERYTAPAWGASLETWAGGWTVDRMRVAIQLHDGGRFRESTAASKKVTQHAAVFGALSQRMAPTMRFQRSVEGGEAGLDGVVREEAEGLFVGKAAELGPAFPSFRGTLRALAMMGFCWWQTSYVPSTDGSVLHPVTQIWPSQSVWFDSLRKVWIAQTYEEGQVIISPDDPRWTLIGGSADDPEDLPWLNGAVRAIGPEYIDAMFARNDRSEYSDVHGQPKPIGILPPDVKTEDENGKAAFDSLESLLESRSGALFPNGMIFQMAAAAVGATQVFKDIIDSAATSVAIVLLGTDGTMKAGSGGVYSSPQFGAVAENRVADDVEAVSDGATRVLNKWKARNYPNATVPLRATIQMPDTQRDARTKSISERTLAAHVIIKAERDSGCVVDQERVNAIFAALDLPPPKLAAVVS